MKVLFTTNYPSPYRVHFFNELGKLCDLTVVFEETPEEQTHRSKEWFVTDYSNFHAIFLENYKIGKSKPDRPHKVIAPAIIKEIKKEYDYRIVGVYSTYSSILAILYMQVKKIPYWIETDGGIAKSGQGLQEKLKKRLLGGAEGYFSPSDVSDEYLIHYGAFKAKIFRYPFTSLFKKDILLQPVGISEKERIRKELNMNETKVILSVGQYIPRKGFDLLLYAVKNMDREIGVYIVGGKAPDEYIQMRKKFNLEERVHFIDFKKKDELAKYYMAADLFVLPTHEDIWGLVINEAMAYGLPIITTNKCVAGLELVTSGNGKIIAINDVKQLQRGILEMLSLEPEVLQKMRQESILRIRKFTFEEMARTHNDVLASQLSKL